MRQLIQQLITAPNLLSLFRILMVPVLLYFAIIGKESHFFMALLLSVFTDALDGYVARHFNLTSELGSHLDSVGDFAIYGTITLCALIMWPQIVKDEIVFVGLIVLSFILPSLVGLIKFHAVTSYHTVSVKFAVVFTLISYVILFAGISPWPFRVASVLCCLAALEEITISFVLKHERIDVKSIWHALHFKKEK